MCVTGCQVASLVSTLKWPATPASHENHTGLQALPNIPPRVQIPFS
jgi:hypothetical protein